MATKAFTHIREAIKSNDVEDRTEVQALYHRLCGLSDGDWLLKEDLYAAHKGDDSDLDTAEWGEIVPFDQFETWLSETHDTKNTQGYTHHRSTIITHAHCLAPS